MRCFLSEENLTLHQRECEKMKSRLSIYEKSLPKIKNMSIKDVRLSRIDKDYKEDILYLKRYLMLHSVYFSSFSEKKRAPSKLLHYFSSREALAYECLLAMKEASHGFLCLYKTNGAPRISILSAESQSLIDPPTLCIEISEHAYFLDYLFDRERYFKSCLEFLNVSMLFTSSSDNKVAEATNSREEASPQGLYSSYQRPHQRAS